MAATPLYIIFNKTFCLHMDHLLSHRKREDGTRSTRSAIVLIKSRPSQQFCSEISIESGCYKLLKVQHQNVRYKEHSL